MACEVIIMSGDGKREILSFTIDERSDLQNGLKNALDSKDQRGLNYISSMLDAIGNSDEDVDLSNIVNKISNDYEVIGEYNENLLSSLYSEGYEDQIKQKLEYLSQSNQQVKILLTEAKGFKYGSIKSHGTVFTDVTGKKIIYINVNQDPDAIARDLNHELSHAIYDHLINLNAEGLADKLMYLYKSLKIPFSKSKNLKIQTVGNKLKALNNPREIYSWIFQDQDVFDFASKINAELVNEISSMIGVTPRGETINIDNNDLNLDLDNIPFSAEDNNVFLESPLYKELSEIYDKHKDSKDWRQKNSDTYDALMDLYKGYTDENIVNMSYSLAKEVTNPVELYKISKGSLVQIPFMATFKASKWNELLNDSEKQVFFGNNFDKVDNEEWLSLSLRKMHNYYNSNNIKPSSDIKNIVYKKYNKREAWQLVKNYPLAYVSENKEGQPYVAVPQKFGEHKSIGKFFIDDVFSYREFSRKDVDYKKASSLNEDKKTYFNKFIKEQGSNAVSYEKGIKFQDDNYEFMKNIVFNGDKSFTSEIVQNNNIKAKGPLGSLIKVAKNVMPGSFVKFPMKYDDGSKSNVMTYGMVLANGSSGFYVHYEDGGVAKNKVISHASVTEIFFPFNVNKELLNGLKEHELMNNTDGKFRELMQELYNPDNKNNFILNFGFLEKDSNFKKDSENYERDLDRKVRMVNKIKQGSIVKYVTMVKGKMEDKLGSFFASDNKYIYVMPKVGNNLVRIAIANKSGRYDSNLKEIVDYEFNDEYNKSAIETAFVDMSAESEYLNYLESLKKQLNDNQIILDSSMDIDPEDQKQSIIEAVKNGQIKQTAGRLLIQSLEKTGGRGRQMDDLVDVINFVKIDNKAKSHSYDSVEQLLSDHQKNSEIAQLKKGDLILYYDINKEGKLFQRWEIVTDFDEDSKLPIVAHRQTNGRINPRTIQTKNIKSIGLQIKQFSEGNLYIEGREGLYNYREKVLNEYKNDRQIVMTKSEAEKLVTEKNSKFSEGARVKYKAIPLKWISDKNRFSFKALADGESNPKGKEAYKIIKSYYKDGKWRTNSIGLKQYQITNSEIYNPSEFSFKQLTEGLRFGSIMKISQKLTNGKVKYYDFFVEKAYESKIKGRVIYEKDVDGIIEQKFFPKEIYENSSVDTKVLELYNANWKVLNKDTRNSNLKGKPINKINKSEELNLFKKSRDSKNDITDAAKRISNLYDVDVQVLSDDAMMELGNSLEIDLSTARGLSHDNKIYINSDKASTAEALHEMGHLIFPGLRAMNPELWNAIKSKVVDHPVYNIIAEKYNTLTEEDLAEETFMTIFGEYYRSALLEQNNLEWHSDNKDGFDEFIKNTSEVVGDIFEMNNLKGVTDTELMNLSLDQIMMQFGNALINGSMNVYFKQSRIITSNIQMQKVYEKIKDSGKLEIKC